MELSPATQGNTALDISSSQDIIVNHGETPTIISAGIFGLLPEGTVGLLLGRSGLNFPGSSNSYRNYRRRIESYGL